MIRGMVHRVTKHLPERVPKLAARARPHHDRLVETGLSEPVHERGPLPLDLLPPPHGRVERREIFSLVNRGLRPAGPPVEPQLLGPHDVTQRAVEAAVAALQVAEVRVARERPERREDPAIGPGIVGEQLAHFGDGHARVSYRAGASSPASSTLCWTVFPSMC